MKFSQAHQIAKNTKAYETTADETCPSASISCRFEAANPTATTNTRTVATRRRRKRFRGRRRCIVSASVLIRVLRLRDLLDRRGLDDDPGVRRLVGLLRDDAPAERAVETVTGIVDQVGAGLSDAELRTLTELCTKLRVGAGSTAPRRGSRVSATPDPASDLAQAENADVTVEVDRVAVDGTYVRVSSIGEPGERAFLLVAGLGIAATYYERLAPHLNENGPVHALD
ncbi:hypothetical protein IAE22_28980, partial [Bacillus sp. S34]|nr:hypothetical protein [Bacillus sp. S34]